MRVGIVGVGLIGGSLALAARERLGAEVAGCDASPEALRLAQDRGVIRRVASSVAEVVDGAQAVFVAVPVGSLSAAVDQALAHASADCVVSDVGSVKRAVVEAIDDPRFVGGHPLAGAETAGVEHARADLFDGATWYLTPEERTSGVLYERLHRMLHGLGARPCAIDAAAHDRILARISHLPHVLANALVREAARAIDAEGEQLPATGPSFRDATRVAGSPTSIWADIYLANRDAVGEAVDGVIDHLRGVREALREDDRQRIVSWNDAAGTARRRLLKQGLAGGELTELRVSVPNRPGVVAQLALALGRAGVNIADMALYPAADMSEGVIALWVAGEPEAERALTLIHGLGFPIARA